MPSWPKLFMAPLLLLMAVAPAGATTFLQERFNGATFPPAGWTVVDNGGSGVVWTNIAGSLEAGNYTGGTGDAATVSSDLAGPLEFDTELRTPMIALPGTTPLVLHFLANYQDSSSLDYLQVDFSLNGGANWTNAATWFVNHGAFRAQPGECVDLDLSGVLPGAGGVIFRFHYFDNDINDFDWYAQVDDVVFDDQLTSPCPRFIDGFESGDRSAWSSTEPPLAALAAGGELRRDSSEKGRLRRAEAGATRGVRRHDRRRRGSKAGVEGPLPAPSELRAPPSASAPPGR